jgi:drug/metabolite transporter (DMT)-like permease
MIAFVAVSLYALKIKIPFKLNLKDHLFFMTFSVVNFSGSYALVYWAEQYINSGLASVLFSVMPFYVAFFAIWFLPAEKISFKKFLGIMVGFLGVLVIFRDQLQFSHTLAIFGMIAVVLSPAFSAMGTIMAKKARMRFHAVTLNTLPLLYTSLTFLIMYLLFELDRNVVFNWPAVISLLYLGIFGTALAFVLYFWLLKTTSAVLLSMITFVTPPLALIWGWLVLGESVSWELLIGMIIIFSGIVIVRKS